MIAHASCKPNKQLRLLIRTAKINLESKHNLSQMQKCLYWMLVCNHCCQKALQLTNNKEAGVGPFLVKSFVICNWYHQNNLQFRVTLDALFAVDLLFDLKFWSRSGVHKVKFGAKHCAYHNTFFLQFDCHRFWCCIRTPLLSKNFIMMFLSCES